MEPDQEAQLKSFRKRGTKWLRSKYAVAFIAFISLVESAFAPIIADPFLIALILANRKRWVYYTTVTIIFSVLGGLLAYAFGLFFFNTIGEQLIELYNMQSKMDFVTTEINNSAFVFVLLGALTPIPYKLVAIASGLLKVDLLTFIVASVIGRSLRMVLVGYLTYLVGPKVISLVQKRLFTIFSIIGIILIVYIIIRSLMG